MMAADNVVTSLRRIVGKRHVLTDESATRSYQMAFVLVVDVLLQ